MMQKIDRPEILPVFPLPGALLLPRARLPLNLFEPRYLAMLDDVLKTDHRLIGMIQPVGESGDTLHTVGCAGRVTAMSETDDGRYMITLTGVSRFRTVAEVEGFPPYRRFKADWSDFDADLGKVERDETLDRPALMGLLDRFFEDRGLSTDWDGIKDAEPELLINSLSMLCPFEPDERQALLEAPTLQTRREMLETLIEYALRGGDTEQRMM